MNPRHIAIILDGNRRFAKKLLLKPWKGHEWGARKLEQLLNWVAETGIQELTLYAFSIQNFSRPKEEFSYLMDLFTSELQRLADDKRISENGIRIIFAGRLHLFPEKLQELMSGIMENTKNNSKFFVNIAMAYGGREEIEDAMRKIAYEVENGNLAASTITEQVIRDALYVSSEPDLIIRTGGEKRLSNFLPFQSAYSELFFLEKTWPEFEKEDLMAVLDEYSKRERRFGR